jgi:hypothetical protein
MAVLCPTSTFDVISHVKRAGLSLDRDTVKYHRQEIFVFLLAMYGPTIPFQGIFSRKLGMNWCKVVSHILACFALEAFFTWH